MAPSRPPEPHGDASRAPWRPADWTADDGWLGTRELPGYRAGALIVRFADLPGVDAEHLYLDVLRLGDDGRIDETVSGACPAMPRTQPLDARSRFVRVVGTAAPRRRCAPWLTGLGPAIALLRENGIEGPQLAYGGPAPRRGLQRRRAGRRARPHARAQPRRRRGLGHARRPAGAPAAACRGGSELADQVGLLVRRVGRAQARRRLREATDFELLPTPICSASESRREFAGAAVRRPAGDSTTGGRHAVVRGQARDRRPGRRAAESTSTASSAKRRSSPSSRAGTGPRAPATRRRRRSARPKTSSGRTSSSAQRPAPNRRTALSRLQTRRISSTSTSAARSRGKGA